MSGGEWGRVGGHVVAHPREVARPQPPREVLSLASPPPAHLGLGGCEGEAHAPHEGGLQEARGRGLPLRQGSARGCRLRPWPSQGLSGGGRQEGSGFEHLRFERRGPRPCQCTADVPSTPLGASLVAVPLRRPPLHTRGWRTARTRHPCVRSNMFLTSLALPGGQQRKNPQ